MGQMQLDLDCPSASTWEFRDFHGFRQAREVGGAWKFYIRGFQAIGSRPGAELCNVLLSNGSYEAVPIDDQDRILIAGRRFGRDHWDH